MIQPWRLRFLPTATIAASLLAAALLWRTAPHAYTTLLDLFSFHVYQPPFLDSHFFTAQRRCWLAGVDVYATNPCDQLQRVFTNSPVWLRLSIIPPRESAATALGLGFAAMFAASLALVPLPLTLRGRALYALALVSPATAFALERGNPDLMMFAIAAAAACLSERAWFARIAGYALALTGAVLKFYPLALLVLVMRESWRAAAAVLAATALLTAVFIVCYAGELAKMLPNIPRPDPLLNTFGARQFPLGITFLTGIPLRMPALLLLIAACLALTWRIASNPAFATALSGLARREASALLAGAAILAGCFFSAGNIHYRAIYLLLTLPGLITLGAALPPNGPQLVRATPVIAVVLAWNPVFSRLASGGLYIPQSALGGIGYLLVWCLREALWWAFVSVLMAVVVRRALTSPLWKSLTGNLVTVPV